METNPFQWIPWTFREAPCPTKHVAFDSKSFREGFWRNIMEWVGNSRRLIQKFKSVRTKTSRQLLAYVPVPKLLSETDCRPVRARSRLLPWPWLRLAGGLGSRNFNLNELAVWQPGKIIWVILGPPPEPLTGRNWFRDGRGDMSRTKRRSRARARRWFKYCGVKQPSNDHAKHFNVWIWKPGKINL
jgi:hypothetical protein